VTGDKDKQGQAAGILMQNNASICYA